MSANWGDNTVWELFTPQAEDKIHRHITGTINDWYCHVTPLLLFRKPFQCVCYVTVDVDAVDLHVTPALLFCPTHSIYSTLRSESQKHTFFLHHFPLWFTLREKRAEIGKTSGWSIVFSWDRLSGRLQRLVTSGAFKNAANCGLSLTQPIRR